MDLSLTIITIVYIVILVIPGIFFKRFYFQGPFNRQFQSGQFADRLLTSIFWGIVTQLIFFYAFINTFEVEFESIFELLIQTHQIFADNQFPSLEQNIFTNSLYYLIGSVLFAVLFGFLLNRFVRVSQLDLKTNVLRFSNKWHYYFSGEILKTKEFKGKLPKDKAVIGSLVDVLVKYGEGDDRLFSGNLIQYTINSDGNLETLYLAGARRYSDSNGEKIPPKEIPGDCFVIPYNTVLNLNIQYLMIEKLSGNGIEIAKRGFNFIVEVFLFGYLISSLVFPWYTDAEFFLKLLSIGSLLFSWLFLAILIGNWKGPKKQFGYKGSVFIFAAILFFGILGFEFLGFELFKGLFTMFNS